jgi:ubiquinone/menaquinone biosynthesis C-methylase UbiE
MSYSKQHELGLSGLALLRNRLIGDEKTTQEILDEIHKLTKTPKNALSSTSKVKLYSISAGYKAWSDTYDNIPNLLTEVEEPVVKSLLRKFPAGCALDAACGTGRYSEFLHTLGHEVTGVDLSPAMLRHAKSRDKQIKFIKGDLRALPLDNNYFDLAICALALTHFPDINQILTELSRVVQSGGKIIISDIHPWLVVLGGQAEFRNKTGKRGYIRNYIHWHSVYLQAFNQIGLKVLGCLEPTIGQEHLKLAQTGFDLSIKTVRTALLGLPIALVWVLEKS